MLTLQKAALKSRGSKKVLHRRGPRTRFENESRGDRVQVLQKEFAADAKSVLEVTLSSTYIFQLTDPRQQYTSQLLSAPNLKTTLMTSMR